MGAPDVLTATPTGRGRPVLHVIERLAEFGSRRARSRDEALRQGTLIFASVVIAIISFVWVGTYLAHGHVLSAAVPAAYQVITVVGLFWLSRNRGFVVFRVTQLVSFLVLPALLQASLGGFVASSGMVLWAIVVPLAALALLGVRGSVGWLLAFLLEVFVLALLDPMLSEHPAGLPVGFVVTFFVLNVLGVTVSAYAMLGYFVEQRELARVALEAEQERSERLLLNVLPAAIADRLKHDPGIIAEHHDAVTVLFADLVGFTAQTEVMPADELVALLDRIFTVFDREVDVHSVEKIKTIGDAYMVAGGLPDRRPDHVDAVARVALAMRAAIAAIAREPGCGWLAVRIGIDTGPAVAGVIGRRKFIYDLWGDTVNTASRMDSHGLPGEIHVTERVARALGDEFVVRLRGVIPVKGKGEMRTFIMDAQQPGAIGGP